MSYGKKVATIEGSITGWKRVISIVQVYKGITRTEPLNGFETMSLGTRQVRELKVDHMQQTCRWVPRKAKGFQPAPALGSWNLNVKLMAEQFGNSFTIMGCDPPHVKDKFWSASGADIIWQTMNDAMNDIQYDFCKYSLPTEKIFCN
ncbi:hypothetical protein FPOAC2_06406 [Fusarium poae]|uniref:hypothetical protein n=1 Tax=Fusarium poae TaxID=36050 RepID=UPI001CE84C95|nr:hypothetical protein FPOAC1_006286 [Fusarium poae]KAG8672984.1 hypothetical protein FPOAC1_006286 [Fusarium poae]